MSEVMLMFGDIFLRSLLSAIILFFLAKLMGFKQISQFTYFDYVVGITIGSIAAQMSFDREIPYHYPVIAMIIYALIALGFSLVTLKSVKARRYLNGSPVILIDKGKILDRNLKTVKLDINDLLSQCRSAGYFNITDLEYAVMEPNGTVSFLPKSTLRPVTPQDISLKVRQETPAPSLIIDGRIMKENLKNSGFDENWLQKELDSLGVGKVQNIFFGTLDSSNHLYVYLKNPDSYKRNPYS